jgi:hypothetical protein
VIHVICTDVQESLRARSQFSAAAAGFLHILARRPAHHGTFGPLTRE